MKSKKRKSVTGGQTRGESKKGTGREAVTDTLKWLAPGQKSKAAKSSVSDAFGRNLAKS